MKEKARKKMAKMVDPYSFFYPVNPVIPSKKLDWINKISRMNRKGHRANSISLSGRFWFQGMGPELVYRSLDFSRDRAKVSFVGSVVHCFKIFRRNDEHLAQGIGIRLQDCPRVLEKKTVGGLTDAPRP